MDNDLMIKTKELLKEGEASILVWGTVLLLLPKR